MATKIEIKENGINFRFSKKISSFIPYSHTLKIKLINLKVELPFIVWLKIVNAK